MRDTTSFADRVRAIDLYALLDIKPEASDEEIRRAYRHGALACHPDKHPNDQQAAERFVLLTHARDVLLNPAARESYDRLRRRHGHGLDDQEQAGAARSRRRSHADRVWATDPLSEHRLADRARLSRSAGELAALWQVGSVVVRAEVLRNKACPIGLFRDPHVEGHWMLSLEAASRAQCPSEVLAKLALSFEHCVAAAVAAHPRTPADALGVIAVRHRDLSVLGAIATHPNADAAVLREVGRAVRGPRTAALGSAVIAHPACPSDVAQRIRSRLGDMVA